MNCLILAAGYATRLYPLTENMPKPLLEVKGKTILDWLIDDIDSSGMIEKYIVVSNAKFAENFEAWAKKHSKSDRIVVVNDGTCTNETRLGAVADILFAKNELSLKGELMVIAGDNVLDFSLCRFLEYYKTKKCSCLMRYFEPRTEVCKKSGVITFDENDKITSMEEKPENPKSNWLTPPFYIYTAEDIEKVGYALENGCHKDAPGSFAAWLSKETNVCAMEMPGKRYDIGNLESYKNVCETYNGIER